MRKLTYLLVLIIPILFIFNCNPKTNPVSPTVSGGASRGTQTGSGTEKSKQIFNINLTGSIKVQNTDYDDYYASIRIYDVATSDYLVTFYGSYNTETKIWTPYSDSRTVHSYGAVKLVITLLDADSWTNISTTELGSYVLTSGDNTIVISGSIE